MLLKDADGQTRLPVASSQRLLEELVRSELQSDDVSISLVAGSNKGDNYIGVLFRARAECRRTRAHLNVIVKLPPLNEARRKQFFARPSFEREIYFYTEIYPMMESFQRERGLDPAGNGADTFFNQIPKCYRTCLVDQEEAILMGDLRDDGFDMFDRHKLQRIEHFQLVVKVLGRLHALSFALKDQQPDRIQPYKDMVELFTTRGDEDESMETWFNMLIARTTETLDETAEPEVYAKTMAALSGKFMNEIRELTSGKSAEPYAVICHGDCWNNNIMFKEQDGIPVDVRLLDWQISRYASPVLDLMYYIFTASTKPFRDEHYESLLELYYQSLSDFLRQLGSDPEECFPRRALDEQLHRFGRFGLLMAVMLLPVITTKSEDIPDLEQIAEKMENGFDVAAEVNNFRSSETEDIYRTKMADCCRDMVRLGYI